MNIEKLKKMQSKIITGNRIINIVFLIIWGFFTCIIFKGETLTHLEIMYIAISFIILISGMIFKNFFASLRPEYLIEFFIILIVPSIYFDDASMPCVFMAIAIFIIRLVFSKLILHDQIHDFDEKFKKIFVLETLKKVFNNIDYDPYDGFDPKVLDNTKIIDRGTGFSSNDYFEAEYNNIKVRYADVYTYNETINFNDIKWERDSHKSSIFKGKWMIFEFNKKFNTKIRISNKSFIYSRLSSWSEKGKYKKIQTGDNEFDKKFNVYVQDEQDAFNILTPTLIENIKKINSELKGKLLIAFIDNELHICLNNNKDSFEYHNVYKKLDEKKVEDDILHDIKIITNFIDQLNYNK